jgi:hypothetical protein
MVMSGQPIPGTHIEGRILGERFDEDLISAVGALRFEVREEGAFLFFCLFLFNKTGFILNT